MLNEQDIINLLKTIDNLTERVIDLERKIGELTQVEVVSSIGDVPASKQHGDLLVLVKGDGLYRFESGVSQYEREL